MTAYRLIRPAYPGNIIIDSPHSGAAYPADFDFTCSLYDLRQAEDTALDTIAAPLAEWSAHVLCAEAPRSYIDLNRAIDDIDPSLCAERIEAKPSSYSRLGVGLIHRDARPGMAIYKRKLAAREIQQRIEKIYLPYHAALASLIDDIYVDFGEVLHINLHSMPSAAAPLDRNHRAYDLVIGTADGKSVDLALAESIADIARGAGLNVGIDQRYKGGHIIRTYGDPEAGIHSLQLEFNRALYLNERTGQLTGGADRMTQLLIAIASDWQLSRQAFSIAAE